MKKLYAFWITLAAAFLALNLYQARDTAPRLPLPEDIRTAAIAHADASLTFTRTAAGWQLDGRPASKFGAWLAELPTACPIRYSADAVENAMDDPITLTLNGTDEWRFGAHNDLSRSHYVQHGSTLYLCDERLKPRLALPASYWTRPTVDKGG